MLTLEHKATNYETYRHIDRVRVLLNKVITELLHRGEEHDQSKLESPEVEVFTEFTPKLAGMTYGSSEFNECKSKMSVALAHHYAKNSHHPEHYKRGIEDMTLIDIIEMLVDWKASSERHHDGNILKSIEINSDRFSISPQLAKILENTARNFLEN